MFYKFDVCDSKDNLIVCVCVHVCVYMYNNSQIEDNKF